MKKITVMIPCHNEQDCLPHIYQALCEVAEQNSHYQWELLFVNDGSTDRTRNCILDLAATDPRVRYITLSRNFGKENAMLAGFDYATGDALVIIDADLQDPPQLIGQMLHWWGEGYDDVYARRTTREGQGWFRRKLTMTFYALLQRTTRMDVLENVGDFRLLDRKCVEALRRLRENERYTKGMYAWIGFKKKELTYEHGVRTGGRSSWSFFSLMSLAVNGLTSFTVVPLRFSTIIGMFVSFFALIRMIWVFVKALIWGDPVAGYPSLMVVILFLGGVQLLSLGIIGEYLGRVFNETKNRPVYIVSETNIEGNE
ncbi:MAG: glycosyltransferase family 2 protein [Bacteroidaceae bacterium]|nr:glycosyltransferase family 2 protein [Bacteroidaceae bacterium]